MAIARFTILTSVAILGAGVATAIAASGAGNGGGPVAEAPARTDTCPAAPSYWQSAPTPPLERNSYAAFGDSVVEDEVMANAKCVKENLLPHVWNYIVVDFRWYDPEPTGDDHALNQKRTGAKLASDAFGRMVPAENRFPSSAGGKGFKPL